MLFNEALSCFSDYLHKSVLEKVWSQSLIKILCMSYVIVVWGFLVAFGVFEGMADVLYTYIQFI